MEPPQNGVDPPDRRTRELIGTIELIATLIVVLVLIAFAVWFLFIAHNPLLHS